METVDLMRQAVNQGMLANIIINNEDRGNALMLAQLSTGKFLQRGGPASKH